MGCFDMMCCVSGLPILPGDGVMWVLLAETPWRDELVHGEWFLRTWPVKGVYNDYGSITDYQAGPLTQMVVDGLKLDFTVAKDTPQGMLDAAVAGADGLMEPGPPESFTAVLSRVHEALHAQIPGEPRVRLEVGMIRLDVWDGLLAMHKKRPEIRMSAQNAIQELTKAMPALEPHSTIFKSNVAKSIFVSAVQAGDVRGRCAGVTNPIMHLLPLLKAGVPEEVLDVVVDTLVVTDVLQDMQYTFRPSGYGGQEQNFWYHAQFHHRCAQIAEAQLKQAADDFVGGSDVHRSDPGRG